MATAPRKGRQIERMAIKFLYCRSERHMWDLVGDRDLAVNTKGYVTRFTRHTKCIRCGAQKFQSFLLPGFHREKPPTVIYPKNYLSREGRMEQSDVRAEQLTRRGLKLAGVPEPAAKKAPAKKAAS